MHTTGISRQNSTIPTINMEDVRKKADRPVAKKVQFSAKHILTCRKLTPEEKLDTWWTPSEFQAVRTAAKLVTRDIRKNAQCAIADIDETYTTALHLSCTLDDEAYESFLEDPSEFSGCLDEWCHTSCWGRGLEKYTSAKHRYERTEFAKEARAAVVRLHGNPDLHENEIAAFYKDYSRASCIYARLVGVADSDCLRETEPQPDPRLEMSPMPTVYPEERFNPPQGSPVSTLANLNLIDMPKASGLEDSFTHSEAQKRRIDLGSQRLVRQLSQRIENAV